MAFFRKTFDKLSASLAKTRQKFVRSVQSVLPFGRKIDEDLLDELEETLIAGDIGVKTAMQICDDLREAWREKKIASAEEVIPFLKQEIVGYWGEADRSIRFAESGPTVILVAGVNGTGKTTSVAKLAHAFHTGGKKVCLAAADTFRAAAVEQLTIWSERLGVDIIKQRGGTDPAAVVFDACDAAVARGADILLVDTAGRLHTQANLMRELTKIRDVVARKIPGAPHEVILVLDATTGQNAIEQAKKFQDAIDVTGIFLAKLDGTAKGGIVIAIRKEINIPVKFVGVGETPEDVEPFDPETFVEALFQ